MKMASKFLITKSSIQNFFQVSRKALLMKYVSLLSYSIRLYFILRHFQNKIYEYLFMNSKWKSFSLPNISLVTSS